MTTKSSLAHIEAVATATLEREITKPTLPAAALQQVGEKGRQRVAGFIVHDNAGEKTALKEAQRYRKGRIEQYRSDREELTADLAKRGIVPKAILPTNAWQRICRESGLVRLAPDHDGHVRIAAVYDRFSMTMGQAACVLWAINLAVIAYAMVITWFASGDLGLAAAVGFVTAMVTVGATALTAFFCNEGLDTRLREYLIRGCFSLRVGMLRFWRWESILALLFPNGEERQERTLTARVILPQPPEEFVATLLKARGLQVKVAAEPKAIGFAEHPAKILKREGLRQLSLLEEERRQRDLARWEPIAYVEKGLATAILDQFGDFMIEKQVVEKVMTTDFVP